MQIPNLPTDNLYKFLALSGLVIVLLSIGYPMSRMPDVNQRIVELNAELKILELEVKRHETEESRLSMDVNRLEKDISTLESKKRTSGREVTKARNNANELKAKHDAGVAKTDELKVKLIQLEAKRDAVVYLVSELRYLVNSMYIGVIVGNLLMWLGFTLWYVRVQKPQDLLLRQQISQRHPNNTVERDARASSARPTP